MQLISEVLRNLPYLSNLGIRYDESENGYAKDLSSIALKTRIGVIRYVDTDLISQKVPIENPQFRAVGYQPEL